jgi:hypothetical protein
VSWPRAIVVGVLTVVVAFAALVVAPDQIINLSGMSRSTKVALATVWFTVALVGLSWALRKLQDRHIV